MRNMEIIALVAALLVGTVATTSGGDEPEWPCFHGERRDNRSAETGLLKTWPEDGPQLLWTASGIGHGYSSVAVAHGRILTAGMIEGDTYVVALDMNGHLLWRRPNGESWQAPERQLSALRAVPAFRKISQNIRYCCHTTTQRC